jgi:hypothetical protein
MKRLLLLILIMLLTACGSASKSSLATEEPVSTIALPTQTEIENIIPTPLPTPQATLSIITSSSPESNDVPIDAITSFAQLPGNQATGEPAPDFTARLLGGGTFVLSKERGKYWLVLPTTFGCGECAYSLYLLSQAQPEDPVNLNILVLDIYQPDLPEYWQSYADAINQPYYHWAVVDTPTFMEDYDIYGLGTFLVIDPDGRLVFQSSPPPPPEYITELFTLAQSEGVKCEYKC